MLDSKEKKAIADVRRAAKLIDEYGWQRGGYGSCATGFCISGAILHPYSHGAAEPALKDIARAHAVIATYLRSIGRTEFMTTEHFARVVVRFNDLDAKDIGDVLTIMREAADYATKIGSDDDA